MSSICFIETVYKYLAKLPQTWKFLLIIMILQFDYVETNEVDNNYCKRNFYWQYTEPRN